jgi:hypothetical protein
LNFDLPTMPEKITESKTMANQPQLPPAAVPPAPQDQSSTEPTLKKPGLVSAKSAKKEKKGKLSWKVVLIGISAGLFILTFVVSIIFQQAGRTPSPTTTTPQFQPTPTTAPLPSIPDFPITDPSIYVDDPQVLQLQSSLETLLKQLDEVDLREADLNPPVLDLEVRLE